MFPRRYKVMNSCIHLCTTGQAYFYSTIFEKRLAQQRFLGVALLANNLYQRAWARRQIDAAEPWLYSATYPGARNLENSSEAVNLFLFETGSFAHSASLLPSQLN